MHLLVELFYIGIPVVWTDGRSGVRSRDYQNFSDGYITKFSYPWCSASLAWSSAMNYFFSAHLSGVPVNEGLNGVNR